MLGNTVDIKLHKKRTVILMVTLALTLVVAILVGIKILSHRCTPLQYATSSTSHVCGQVPPYSPGYGPDGAVDNLPTLKMDVQAIWTENGGYFPTANQITQIINHEANQYGWPESIKNPANTKPVEIPDTLQVGVGMCVAEGQKCQLVQIAIKYSNTSAKFECGYLVIYDGSTPLSTSIQGLPVGTTVGTYEGTATVNVKNACSIADVIPKGSDGNYTH